MKKLEQTSSVWQKENTDLGGFLTTGFIFLMLAGFSYSLKNLNATPPRKLNEFPHNLKILCLQGLMPAIYTSFLCVLFFSQSKALRREFMQRIYNRINNVWNSRNSIKPK